MSQYALGFIGGGHMAEGILAAVLEQKVVPLDRVLVSDVSQKRLATLKKQYGIATTPDSSSLVATTDNVMLAIKPQSFPEVAETIASSVNTNQLIISIMAGVGSAKIADALGEKGCRVVRVMPNLPIRVGAGIAGVCGGKDATPEDVAWTCKLFEAGGGAVVVDDEKLIDAVTAVSGSGPAYFYYFVEAIVAGGVEAGLTEDDALKLAEYTCLGAARMMLETKEAPAELRRKVTSKGGTTQAALESMEKSGVAHAIAEAVKAAYQRGRELGS